VNIETTTHTPGPWSPGGRCGSMQPDSVKKYNGQPYQETTRVQVTTPDGFIKGIAFVYQGEGGVGSPQALAEQNANMALICAAPELLAALNDLDAIAATLAEGRDLAEALSDAELAKWKTAREAIAKATGGAE